jgi:3-hydroxybutyryl-CoA dehydrogenase
MLREKIRLRPGIHTGRRIMTIAVVGLGAMGLGIALVYAQAGLQVQAFDMDAGARLSAPDRLRAALEPRVAKGHLGTGARDEILSRITVVDSLDALAPAGLVIEAIIEDLGAKRALFRAIEGLAPRAVLATNTSSLSVQGIAADLRRPDRLVGLHFFNPAPVMRLVELIGPPGVDPQALALARRLTEAAGKTVVDGPDRPGFVVNRCARPFYGEALALLEEGRDPREIDAAMQGAGYRLGPFALIDLVGADINLAATQGLARAMGGHPRYHIFEALSAQVATGHLGRKTGRGFVCHAEPVAAPLDADIIVSRIETCLANEAAWLLAEGGVTRDGIDTALKLGLNFPRGPFEIIARDGRAGLAARLAQLESRAPLHLRGRYLPAPALCRD